MKSGSVRLIEEWYYQMWNQWDKTLFEEILAQDITFRGSLGEVNRGYNGISGYMDLVRGAFPNFTNSIEETISEWAKAFARLIYTDTHEGKIFGVPPTRKTSYAGAAVFHFDGNKIIKVWVLGDLHGLLQQLELS